MSRQELKDEMKQSEGDPAMKGRQRARAREMIRKGLLKQIKRSDVVIANPTHVSVALRYRAEEGAPIVTAKGVDEVALYIRELAKKHGVPIVENIPLARALNAKVKVGKTIPMELYKAAAEVLAFVYRLKARTIKA
jgi:flagellar biosynthesis protein FlhB